MSGAQFFVIVIYILTECHTRVRHGFQDIIIMFIFQELRGHVFYLLHKMK
jgi:hypothetical protein